MRSNIVDLTVIYHHETEKAVLVSDAEGSDKVWLPKSQIEIEGDRSRGSIVTITLPEPLATEKGLI